MLQGERQSSCRKWQKRRKCGDNCSARIFLLSNACVSFSFMEKEGEKPYSVLSEDLKDLMQLMGQTKEKQILVGRHDSYTKSHLVGSQNCLCSAGDYPNKAAGNTRFLEQSLYCKRISRREGSRDWIPNRTSVQSCKESYSLSNSETKAWEGGGWRRMTVRGQGFFFKDKTEKNKLTFSLDTPHILSSSSDFPEQRSMRGAAIRKESVS